MTRLIQATRQAFDETINAIFDASTLNMAQESEHAFLIGRDYLCKVRSTSDMFEVAITHHAQDEQDREVFTQRHATRNHVIYMPGLIDMVSCVLQLEGWHIPRALPANEALAA